EGIELAPLPSSFDWMAPHYDRVSRFVATKARQRIRELNSASGLFRAIVSVADCCGAYFAPPLFVGGDFPDGVQRPRDGRLVAVAAVQTLLNVPSQYSVAR